MAKPAVSVVIPVYNVEKYLRQCVDSVLSQTYENIEIILVDDGSTDSSGEICDSYQRENHNVKVIHRANSGLSVSRNRGLENSSGKYVYFLDSDDFITEYAIKSLVDIAEREKSDIVFFDGHSFADPEGSFEVKQTYIRRNVYKTTDGYNMFCQLTKNKEFRTGVPLLFFKRSFLVENELEFEEGILYEDVLFSFVAFYEAGIVSQCKEVLYQRRYRKDSIMTKTKKEKNFTSAFCVYRLVSSYVDIQQRENSGYIIDYVVRCAFNVFNIYEELETTEKSKCAKELEEFIKNLRMNEFHNNKSLQYRSKSKLCWVIYKVWEKTLGRVFNGK